ncbi:hypothetical protein JHW43_004318 [Diplocarpon mali]|nr:hypothetical protein JHW43_004318 [Diplocarpon mali]
MRVKYHTNLATHDGGSQAFLFMGAGYLAFLASGFWLWLWLWVLALVLVVVLVVVLVLVLVLILVLALALSLALSLHVRTGLFASENVIVRFGDDIAKEKVYADVEVPLHTPGSEEISVMTLLQGTAMERRYMVWAKYFKLQENYQGVTCKLYFTDDGACYVINEQNPESRIGSMNSYLDYGFIKCTKVAPTSAP